MSDRPVPTPPPEDTDFGFSRVPRAEKGARVRAVFDSVAQRYDVMNDLMSLGLHRIWKRVLITALDPRPSRRLLDLAAGTGDVGFGWLGHGGGPAIMADVNPNMVGIARDRGLSRGFAACVEFLVADAERLPLPDRCVDVAAIAFGLRNCTDKPAVLAEARRVLRPGGRFFCLEFSHLGVAVAKPLYDLWSFRVVPRLGGIVARDADSYVYLAESIRVFPDAPTLADMMEAAGFARVDWCALSGGIVAIHSGWRL